MLLPLKVDFWVAQGCQLVDVELMTAQWSNSDSYLRPGDKLHQDSQLALATLNIYLNIIDASGARNCSQPPRPQQPPPASEG